MHSFTKMRLQLRITLLTVLGLGLVMAAFAFLGLRAVDERGRQIRQERLSMARTIAHEMDRALEHIQRTVQVSMGREGIDLGDQDLEPETHALHDAYLLSMFPIYRLLLLDGGGVVRLAQPEGTELIGTDLSRLAAVARGLESGESVVSGLVPQQALGQPAVLLTVPLMEGWMVFVAIDLLDESLAGLLASAAPGQTGHVQLVDREGAVLISTRPKERFQPWHHGAALAELWGEAAAGVGLYPALPGGRDLVAFVPLTGAPWAVAVEQTEAEAMAPARRLQRQFLVLGLATLIVALLLVWVTTRQVVCPVQTLTARARGLAAGELDEPVPPMGEDEIGELAQAFEAMRASLSDARRETEFLLDGLNRAAEEADRLAARLSGQYAIAAVLSRSLGLDELYQTFAAELGELIPFDRMSVAIVSAESTLSTVEGLSADMDGREGELRVSAATGVGEAALPRGMVLDLEEGPAGWVMTHRQPLVCDDLAEDNRFFSHEALRQAGLRSYIVLPLLVRERPLGILNLGSRQPRAYDEDDLAFLEAVAGQLAVAIENARLYEETQQQAITDPLTGLYNRRRFEERVAEEIQRARRYEHPLAMVMADIDRFKRYNDTHGHPQGDVVLQKLARLLQTSVRGTDLVARYGGEEFAILLPETSKAGALAVAEKIRAAVAGHPFPSEETQPGGRLTISLGVATFPEDVKDPAELVHRADEALYRAKAEGRNRVCSQ